MLSIASSRLWSAFVILSLSAACATIGPAPARPPLPGVTDEAAPEWVQVPGLDALFKREPAGALAPFQIASKDGRYRLQVEASAAPTNEPEEEGLYGFAVPLGDDALVCTVHPIRLLPAHTVAKYAAALKGKLDIKALGLAQVTAVDGSPLAIYDLVYTSPAGAGTPQVGELKLAIFTGSSRSMICVDDRPGYRDAFQRVVKQLAHSLTDAKATRADPLAFNAVMVTRLGGRLIGWSYSRAYGPREGGTHQEESATSLLFPTDKAGVPLARDVARFETFDKDGALLEGGYELWRDVVLTDVGLKREGQRWVLDGTEGGKPLKGPVAVHGQLRSPHAAELLAVAAGAKAELRFLTYNPLRAFEASEEVVTREPSRPNGVAIRVAGEVTMIGSLDANGVLESGDMPAGPLPLSFRRISVSGSPP